MILHWSFLFLAPCASFQLLDGGLAQVRPHKWVVEGHGGQLRKLPVQRRQIRQADSKSKLKVLDFHSDNDQLADRNGEFTSATLIGGRLPDSFSICVAYMVEAWHTEQSAADLFSLQDDQDVYWGNVYVVASPTYMQYILELGPIFTANVYEEVAPRARLSTQAAEVHM